MGDFVKLSPDKKHLELNGQPFRIVGANSYHVQTHGADNDGGSGRQNIAKLLKVAKQEGVNVLRIWAHSEHCEEFKWWDHQKNDWIPFSNTWKIIQKQPTPDGTWYKPNIDPDGIDGLDWVVAEAGKLGIKLIMSLTNYWNDYGGMPQYARWATGKKDGLERDMQEEFLRNGNAQSMLKAYIQFLLNRENPYTNKLYKDDPTILAWSLANEPRGGGDTSGNRLDDWIKDTTDYIRSVDKNHLITVDTEGFFIRDDKVEIGPDEKIDIKVDYMNPGERSEGCDFLRNASHPNVDFACIHMYQEKWAPDYAKGDGNDAQQWKWIYKWLDVHLAICKKKLQKPLVLSEFSEIAYNDDFAKRREFLKKVYRWLEKGMYSNDFVAGSCYWMICEDNYKNSDGDK